MATLDTPPGLDAIVAKLKANRGFLIGGAVLLVLGVLIYNFIQGNAEKERYKPWRTLAGEATPKFLWELDASELEQVAGEVDDDTARGLAVYWNALKRYDAAKDPEEKSAAATALKEFLAEYSDHPLMTTPFLSGDPSRGTQPAGVIQILKILALEDAGSENPTPTQNASRPSLSNTLTVVTDEGEATISLYVEQSSESCRALRKHLSVIESGFIVTAVEDRYIELGMDNEGSPIELEGVESDFPPDEANGLSLFKGTVTFRQRPYTDGPYNAVLKVWLEDSFRQDGTYTVIGEVTDGLDALEDMARLDKDENIAGNLDAPIEIKELRLELPDLPADEVPEETDSGSSDEESSPDTAEEEGATEGGGNEGADDGGQPR